jgi:hypothetical protein
MEIHAGIGIWGDAFEAGVHEAHELKAGKRFAGEAAERVLLLWARVVETLLPEGGDLGRDFSNLVDRQRIEALECVQQMPHGCRMLLLKQDGIACPGFRFPCGVLVLAGIRLPLVPTLHAEDLCEFVDQFVFIAWLELISVILPALE